MTWPTKETNTKTNTLTQTKTFREHPHRAILKTWPFSTESNCDNWAPYIMTIILTWLLRVTMDNIHNSCIVSIAIAVSNSQAVLVLTIYSCFCLCETLSIAICSKFVSFCKVSAKRRNERRKGIISKMGMGRESWWSQPQEDNF